MADPQMRIRPRFILGLIVVFVIVPAIISLFVPVFGGPKIIEKTQRVRTDILSISRALESYEVTYGYYPTNEDTAEILTALTGGNPSQRAFLIYGQPPTQNRQDYFDPWATPYQIVSKFQTNLTISSAGRNKRFGDEDDWIFDLAVGDFLQRPKK